MRAPTRGFTRRQFVRTGAALAATMFTGGAAARLDSSARSVQAPPSPLSRFVTEPAWDPPAVTVTTPAAGTAPGLVFVAPILAGSTTIPPGHYGPLILDNDGEPVWFLPLESEVAQNLRVQWWRGHDVLTWYEGPAASTYGGSCVIFDSTYRELKRVHGGNGYSCDLHEFLITDRDTALISIYNEVTTSLSPIGDPTSGLVVEGIVQELDIDTGRVLFEWHSLDHVGLEESYRTSPTAAGNIDYFHLNSIDVDADGGLLVSARHTSTSTSS